MLTIEHKGARKKNMCAEILQRSEKHGDYFLSRIITGDETWIHLYDPLTKRQSMEWLRQSSPRKKISKLQASAGKVVARNLVSGILESSCHSKFKAICADTEQVKTTNSKV